MTGGSAKAQQPDPGRKKAPRKKGGFATQAAREAAAASQEKAEVENPAEVAAEAGRTLAEDLTPSPEEYEDLEPLTLELAEMGVAFLDVQSALERYRDQEGLLAANDRGVPCVHIADEVPLPIGVIPMGADIRSFVELSENEWRLAEILWNTGDTSVGDVIEHDHEEARGFLRQRLSRFLAFRFLGLGSPAPAGSPPGVGSASDPGSPGMPFSVENTGAHGP
jgi:hypothetical protein